MFRIERPENSLNSLLSQTAGGLVQNAQQDTMYQQRDKELSDVLGPLNEDSSPFEWMRGINSLRHTSPEEKKQMLETIRHLNQQKVTQRAAAQKQQAEQEKHQRQSAILAKAHGIPTGQQAPGVAAPQAQKQGTLTPEEIAELPIPEQSRYYKGLEEKQLGGLGGQPIPEETQQRINEVLDKNKYANPEKLRQALSNAKIPPYYIDPIVEDRRESLRTGAENAKANQEEISRSYKFNEDFISRTTNNYNNWKYNVKPRILEISELNKKQLISAPAAVFLEKVGLPVSLAGNPDSELLDKLSHELVTGAGTAFGTNRLAVFEVQQFVHTIPNLLNSAEGREIITANILNFGKFKEIPYEEMRRIQQESNMNGKPLPHDFEQEAMDRASPRLDKVTNQIVSLARIQDMKPGHSVYFDQYDRAVWVPNTTEGRFDAERAGLTPAYLSTPNPAEEKQERQEVPIFNGQVPQSPDEGGAQPLNQSPDQILAEQEHQEPAAEQPPGADFDEPYFQPADEYVDPEKQALREEDTVQWLARNAQGNQAAAAAAVGGTAGDLQELLSAFVSSNFGPYVRDIFGQGAYDSVATAFDWLMPVKFPTRNQLKETIDTATGGYTAPKTKGESRVQELTGDVAGAITSGTVGAEKAVISRGRRALTGLLSAGAGNAGKVVAEELGASEGKAEGTKMLLGMSVSLAGLLSPRNYANSLMNIGRKGFGPYDAADGKRMYGRMREFQKKLVKTDPATEFAHNVATKTLQDIREGKTSMKSLMTMYDGVNRAMRGAGMFDLARSDRKVAKHYLTGLKNIIKNEINHVGKSNPEALKAWNNGVIANAVVHETQWAGNIAQDYIQSAKLAKAAPYGMGALFSGGVLGVGAKLGLPQVGVALSPAVTAGIKSLQVMSRIYKSPELAKYYFQAIADLTARNRVAFANNYDSLVREYNKKFPKEKNQ